MISFGFFYRQFFFFAAVIGLLAGAGWVVTSQRSQASASRPIRIESSSSAQIDLTLADYGMAQIGSEPVKNVIDFLPDHDELRYLLLDNTDAQVGNLTVNVHFPRTVDASLVTARAIIIHNATASFTTQWLDQQTLVFSIPAITPGTTLTLEVLLPKGIITPSLPQQLFGRVENLPQVIWLVLAIVLPLVTLMILGLLVWANLRERWSTTTEQRPTPPDDLTPAVAGVLVDGRVSARTIGATLLDLARREYIDIGSVGDSYTFTKRRRLLDLTSAVDLQPHEQALLGKIFADGPQSTQENIQIRIGSSLFSKKVAEMYLTMYEAATRLGYFHQNPSVTQGSYRLAGLGLFFLGVIGFGFGAAFFGDAPMPLLFWVGTIVAALVVIAVAPHMPVHTTAGIRQRRRWIAFRNYLANPQEIDYTSQTQEQFFAFLPYAVALGVEVEWARRFLRAPFRTPDWYTTKSPLGGLEEFVNDIFPIVGYLAREMAAVKDPTLA